MVNGQARFLKKQGKRDRLVYCRDAIHRVSTIHTHQKNPSLLFPYSHLWRYLNFLMQWKFTEVPKVVYLC
jgi:hypothetical protein